ncbi:MAG: DUF115 domain-containing protein [Bacteroidetes bacterium]|nr:DUF115 domain-containing protein [Bacteroidota bacterium]
MEKVKNLEVLDCTIRDGGYINEWDFSESMVSEVVHRLSMAGVSFIEVGFREHMQTHKSIWRSCPDKLIESLKDNLGRAKISIMVDFGKADEKDFIVADNSPIDLIRIAVHRNKIKSALELIEKLKDLGYLTSLQLMGYSQYSNADKDTLIDQLSVSNTDYVYVADSYGSLFPHQVANLISPLTAINRFKIGFHPHNNLGLAFANTLEAIRNGAIIVDSTLYGMGRGAGNLQTETLLAFLQEYDSEKYNVIHALLLIDLYMLQLKKRYEWGYQLPYMLSGICQCHPTYPKELIATRRYTIDDVWKILSALKHRNPVGFDKKILEDILCQGGFMHSLRIEGSEKKYSTSPNRKIKFESPPDYLDCYPNKPFLVLANGPSLKKNQKEISKFIQLYQPIILGANYLQDLFVPHYHAFVSRKRFLQYAQTVNNKSKLLLSCEFESSFIKRYTEKKYERIFFNDTNETPLDIHNGLISNNCSSVSMLLIAVAYVMGAKSIYVAGLDGFMKTDENGRFYFYDEDAPNSENFNLIRHKGGEKSLANLNILLQNNGREALKIITPTSYEKYYVGLRNFI